MNDMIIKCDIFLKKLVQNKISHIKKIITFVLIDKITLLIIITFYVRAISLKGFSSMSQ